MPLARLAATTSLVAALTLSCFAQSDAVFSPHRKALGHSHSAHGDASVVPDAATTPATTGTYQFTYTIKVASTFVKGTTILCGAYVFADSENESNGASADWEEQSYSTATVSGTTATCTITIPYSWVIPAASSTVQNSVTGEYEITAYSGTSSETSAERYSNGPIFTSTTVPANGSATRYTLTPTI